MSRTPYRNMHGRTNDRPPGARVGFTLIELLVVITIIGILASVSLATIQRARGSARVASTKATIAKLNDIIISRYASYRTRRVPIDTTSMSRKAAQQVRVTVLRDLMRMEMPERWNDVVDGPLAADPLSGNALSHVRPSLSRAYQRVLAAARTRLTSPPFNLTLADANARIGQYGSAECLHMIVTFGDREARGLFSEREIADTDNDTIPEFIDGWGNPIMFLRWAPAFNDSDVQANIVPPSRLEEGTDWADPNSWVTDSHTPAEENVFQRMLVAQNEDHDPFDPQRRDVSDVSPDPPRGRRLMPLIYSAGPDGIYDIRTEGGSFNFVGNPCVLQVSAGPPATYEVLLVGLPINSDNTSVTATGPANGSYDHYDNIHNHRIEMD